MALTSIKEIVPDLVKKVGITSENFALLSIVERELSSVSHGARIVAFKNNRIYVEVGSSVHLFEFNSKKGEILKCLRWMLRGHPSVPLPEIKFFLKGMARPTREERLRKEIDEKEREITNAGN